MVCAFYVCLCCSLVGWSKSQSAMTCTATEEVLQDSPAHHEPSDSAVLLQVHSTEVPHSHLAQAQQDVVKAEEHDDALIVAKTRIRSRGSPDGEKIDVVSLPGNLGVIQKMWDGMDLTPEENAGLLKALGQQAELAQNSMLLEFDPSRSQSMHVLGPPDSGTNLMVRSLHLNWPRQMTRACRSPSMCDMSLWKHSLGDENDLFEHLRGCKDNKCTQKLHKNMSHAVVVVMLRSPISQMVSWKNNPYSLEPCFRRAWGDMHKKCWANTSPVCNDMFLGCSPSRKTRQSIAFKSSVDVYNRYIKEYLSLHQDKRIGRVLLVPYEDLVLTPDLVLCDIAQTMGWHIPKHIKIFGAPAKNHGSCKGRQEAIRRLDSRAWVIEVGQQNVKSICALLNFQAIEGFSEGSHTSEPVTYSYDCTNSMFKKP